MLFETGDAIGETARLHILGVLLDCQQKPLDLVGCILILCF